MSTSFTPITSRGSAPRPSADTLIDTGSSRVNNVWHLAFHPPDVALHRLQDMIHRPDGSFRQREHAN